MPKPKRTSAGKTMLVTTSVSPDQQANELQRLTRKLVKRIQPSKGVRPGRPSDPSWIQYSKIPVSEETARLLELIAESVSTQERKISPMQVAAHLLEEQLKKYDALAATGTKKPRLSA